MKEIKTVGIIGFGVMGAAIGLNAAMSGYRVKFKELNDEPAPIECVCVVVTVGHFVAAHKMFTERVEEKRVFPFPLTHNLISSSGCLETTRFLQILCCSI